MDERCYRCNVDLVPLSSFVFAVADGVEVPFCSDAHMREQAREWPFEVEHVGVTLTPRIPAGL